MTGRQSQTEAQPLKALTGITWGQQKETLVATYKALIDSIFSYANHQHHQAPDHPECSTQDRQCPMMASVDHLHMEAEIMTVREHLAMLCAQFLVSCLQPNHPSFPIVTADSGPRNKKQTLQRRYLAQVESFREEDGSIADAATARKTIHRIAVENSIRARGTNRILGTPPPTHQPGGGGLRQEDPAHPISIEVRFLPLT